MKMTFETQEDFARYVFKRFRESSYTQKTAAAELGITQPAISHAVNPKKFNDTSTNGIRTAILGLFGFNVRKLMQVIKR